MRRRQATGPTSTSSPSVSNVSLIFAKGDLKKVSEEIGKYKNLVSSAERTSSEGTFDKACGLHPQGPFAKAYGMSGECIRRRSIIGYANIWQ
ncbi:hypothetical protein C1H46_017741 [Malus baccata]|uniref:Uncharacterized protein n=1 Tax=Malus baccata TaxID=106549 RepID=A0A540MD38_MALBA|nr:hypothetical protein C1H46_017741 [Malus baccata]